MLQELQDFSEISRATGIPVGTLKRVLGESWEECVMPVSPISEIRSRLFFETVPSIASTVDEAREEYSRTVSRSNAERVALRKWIFLCITAEDILEAYYSTDDGSDEEAVASSKLLDIFSRRFEEMSSLEEIKKLYEETPVGHPAEKIAILKMCEVCGYTD